MYKPNVQPKHNVRARKCGFIDLTPFNLFSPETEDQGVRAASSSSSVCCIASAVCSSLLVISEFCFLDASTNEYCAHAISTMFCMPHSVPSWPGQLLRLRDVQSHKSCESYLYNLVCKPREQLLGRGWLMPPLKQLRAKYCLQKTAG